jgi:2-oxoglutarate dehydrogenase E2 component (dihydrolipoamide succinyltransferase)
MSIELKVPEVGESVHEVQIGRWLKHEGDSVALDENLVELETDKASMELPAPAAGILRQILKREGEMVVVGDVIGYLENGDAKAKSDGEQAAPTSPPAAPEIKETPEVVAPQGPKLQERSTEAQDSNKDAFIKPRPTTLRAVPVADAPEQQDAEIPATPAARRALREHGLKPSDVHHEGGAIRTDDVLRHLDSIKPQPTTPQPTAAAESPALSRQPPVADTDTDDDLEEIVPMSLIRRRIAARLVSAQQTAALLTTFNEIDMTAVKELRNSYKDAFQAKYNVKLGFMPFFVKASVEALKEIPALNAEIRDDKIVYRRYYHIGMAVSSPKGLVVPVLRNAERLSFAGIEQAIGDFSQRAASNKLDPKDFEGGTFTISNGGVFGSLLSTPIVNPPQSGVLGLHAIQDRPVARDGQVVIRSMMYVALTYDHRIIDGREAVTFLRRVKEIIEDPSRMLLEV